MATERVSSSSLATTTTPAAADLPRRPELAAFVQQLVAALDERVLAVVLYGPAARGEEAAGTGEAELNVLVVLRDLELATLAAAGPALARWLKRGLPHPRLVTPETLAAAADVFPIELAEITERHVLVHGRFPHAELPAIDGEHLRLQCERELREKLMRLEEAYAASGGRERTLRQVLVASFPTFAALFRACLRLHTGTPVPPASIAAMESFCAHADIDPSVFVDVDRLRRGLAVEVSVPTLFARYHAAIVRAVGAVDRFVSRSNAP